MKESVYIETTIISYLTAKPSRDIIRLGDQMVTRDWWDTQRGRFELVTSELTVIEASAGDESAAKDRLAALQSIKILDSGDAAETLATALVTAAALPPKELRDALHVAIAATNGVDYLLTWNCTHLANALLQDRIAQTCAKSGFRSPIIITPNQLFDEAYHERRNQPD